MCPTRRCSPSPCLVVSRRVPVKNSRRNGVMNQVRDSLPAAQFLTLHSSVFQLPTTLSLQSPSVGHGPADLVVGHPSHPQRPRKATSQYAASVARAQKRGLGRSWGVNVVRRHPSSPKLGLTISVVVVVVQRDAQQGGASERMACAFHSAGPVKNSRRSG